jgi:hypothetical protein
VSVSYANNIIISGWVNMQSYPPSGSFSVIWSFGSTSTTNADAPFQLHYFNNYAGFTGFMLIVYNNTTSGPNYVGYYQNVALNTWYNFLAVYTPATSYLNINNVIAGIPSGAITTSSATGTYVLGGSTNTTPSNAFNGINYGAMNKADGSRKSFIASKDLLVEFDYSSYHIRILAYHIGYTFDDEDIHTHLATYYFGTKDISRAQYEESKGLTFKLLYTDSVTEEIKDIPFFSKVKEYKDYLWNVYKKQGYIESSLSKRPIRGITSKTQILPFLLQNYETERNIFVINDIIKYLCNKKSKLILYNYDSFLFDYSKEDGKQTLYDLQKILEQGEYKTSCKYGNNYQEMNNL